MCMKYEMLENSGISQLKTQWRHRSSLGTNEVTTCHLLLCLHTTPLYKGRALLVQHHMTTSQVSLM